MMSEGRILEFFSAVFSTYDHNKDGTIDTAELATVLRALGRKYDAQTVDDLIEKFDVDKNGKLDWNNGEFLSVIAAIDVVDVEGIDDLVFSAAFRTFDQDADGLITPLEMHVVVQLFLPMEVLEQDEFVEDLIKKMDKNNDGRIGFNEFVHYVKISGKCDILSG